MELAAPALDLVPCPNCGEANPSRFRLCGMCGSPMAADRAVDEIRRYVTVVNSDLKGSTALGEKLDPESLREVLTRYFDEMRAVFEGYGGTIEKIIGDAIVAVFGMPVRRDDDAIRAVRAAHESMRVLAELNDQLEAIWGVRLTTRTGVSTGDVVVGDVTASQHVLTGETMKVSSAMEQNAPAYGVLLAQPTYDVVRDLVDVEPFGPVTPKGMDEPTEAYVLTAVRVPSAAEGPTAPAVTEAADEAGTKHCSNCGEENSARNRLCGMCGAPLVLLAKDTESRKTVTLVFADPKPRTETGEAPSPEAIRDVMSRYFEAMKVALERHGGTVEKFIGDAVMAVFGLPVRHEDDAARALRAALDMQAALPALNEDFAATWGVRLLNAIGVNTGEVIAGDATLGQRLVTGDAVNVAARLEQAAGPAEVIIGDLTYRLAKGVAEVEPIPPLTLKGKAEPVPAYRLLAVRDMRIEATSSVAPFVGREEEMIRLASALAEAAGARVIRMVTVVGDAGVGKSRLIKEFATRASVDATVLRGRCLPYGDGITFWPIAEVVREAAGIAADDTPEEAIRKLQDLLEREGSEPSERGDVVDRIAAMIGLSSAQFPVAELFWGVRKFLETIGRVRPLVVLIDDIHSAEQTLLELIDHLVEAGRDSQVVLLCSARRELLEKHDEWSAAHEAQLVILEPLSDADSGRLVEELLGQTGLDASVVARITSAAEGNPLFVEQMVSMLIDTGALRQEDGRWIATASAKEIDVPPSIHALLAARFDSLASEEKRVLEPASVIGLAFAVPAIDELVDETVRPKLALRLMSLDRKQFVKPTTLDEDDAYRFAHILVRDTAYGSLLKRARAQYHERFVDWAERINAERGRGQEFEEIHGYHLEQAYRYRTELGVVDDAARTVGRRGAEKLSSAGRRAFARGDAPAAANLLRRATGLLPTSDPARLELLPEVAEADLGRGDFESAAAVLGEAEGLARDAGAQRVAARVAIVDYLRRLSTSGVGDTQEATSTIRAAIREFDESGDTSGLARAWRLMGVIEGTAGRHEVAAEAMRKAIGYASDIGDSRLAARATISFAYATLHGPTPVDEALERCQEFAPLVSMDRSAEAVVLGVLAQLHAMRGAFDEARTLYERSRVIVADLGPSVSAASTSIEASRVEMLAGDARAAEAMLARDFDVLSSMGENYFRSTIAALRAQALWALGERGEAARYALIARDLADEDDVLSQVVWRSVQGKALAAQGRGEDAFATARSAVALTDGSGDIELRADALADLAEALRLMGREKEQGPHLREALALYTSKGDLVMAGETGRRLAAL